MYDLCMTGVRWRGGGWGPYLCMYDSFIEIHWIGKKVCVGVGLRKGE